MNNIFDKNKWDEIIENAFDESAPAPEFSQEYKNRRAKLIMSVNTTRRHIRITALLAAIVSATVLLAVTAVAAGRIFGMYTEQFGEYGQTVKMTSGETVAEGIMSLSIGYLPDGMTLNPESLKCVDETAQRGVSFRFWKVEDLDSFSASITHVLNEKTYEIANGVAVFVDRDGDYDQLWLAFTDTKYVAQVFIMGIDEEEMLRIAEGMSLTPSNEETAEIWEAEELESLPTIKISNGWTAAFDSLTACYVGDTLSNNFDVYNGDEIYFSRRMSVHIDSLEIQKNFDGLTTDNIGNEVDFSKYLNENGEITTERSYISRGDGVNSLDSEATGEVITQSVVILRMTVTNLGDADDYWCVTPQMFHVDENGITHRKVIGRKEAKYTVTNDLLTDGIHFSFLTDAENSQWNMVRLTPGESASVQVAFLVDDDMIDNTYIDVLYKVSEKVSDYNFGNASDEEIPMLKVK